MKHVVSFFVNQQSFDGHQNSFCRRLPVVAPMIGGPTVSVFLANLKQPLVRKVSRGMEPIRPVAAFPLLTPMNLQ